MVFLHGVGLDLTWWDINAPPAAAERIANAITGAQLRLLPGLGHFPPFEAIDTFNQMLGEFVDSVEGLAS